MFWSRPSPGLYLRGGAAVARPRRRRYWLSRSISTPLASRILDDLGYVRKDGAETSVLFELIAERYERRSLIITCNQPFGEWGQIFPDPAITVAAIDRLVHHATILELNSESYRRRSAADARARPSAA